MDSVCLSPWRCNTNPNGPMGQATQLMQGGRAGRKRAATRAKQSRVPALASHRCSISQHVNTCLVWFSFFSFSFFLFFLSQSVDRQKAKEESRVDQFRRRPHVLDANIANGQNDERRVSAFDMRRQVGRTRRRRDKRLHFRCALRTCSTSSS